MAINRIYSIILRNFMLVKHSLDRLTDLFYWPAVDLFLWGLTSFYIKEFAPESSMITLVIISGVVFWLILWRGQNDFSLSLLDDLWNKNLINLFVSPLKFIEWTVSFIIVTILKVLISTPFAMILAYVLYETNTFKFGFYLIPFSILLLMTGWWVGMLVNGIILRYGTKVQNLAWSLVMIISPFSAIYYPLSILPGWAQKIAAFVPSSYVFEGAREVINTGTMDTNKIAISFILNIIFMILAFWFLKRSFNRVLERGLVKLY